MERHGQEPGAWAMTLDPGSVPSGHKHMLLSSLHPPPNSSLNRENMTQYSRLACASLGECRGLGKAGALIGQFPTSQSIFLAPF